MGVGRPLPLNTIMLRNLVGFANTQPPLKSMRCAKVAAQFAQLPPVTPSYPKRGWPVTLPFHHAATP